MSIPDPTQSADPAARLAAARAEMRLPPDAATVRCAAHGHAAPILAVYDSANWVFDADALVTCDPYYPTCLDGVVP